MINNELLDETLENVLEKFEEDEKWLLFGNSINFDKLSKIDINKSETKEFTALMNDRIRNTLNAEYKIFEQGGVTNYNLTTLPSIKIRGWGVSVLD